jgi:3-methyladenine DNA glycosylase/8-oxoguanine DNA glycosylase
MRRSGGVLERLLHVEDEAVVVRVAEADGQASRRGSGRLGITRSVLLGAWGPSAGVCEVALTRMRFALGVDDDLSEFHRRFRDDPLIGRAIRSAPGLRPARRPVPFEALAWAICEQLIEYSRAVAIQRRIVARLGRRAPEGLLRDLPRPDTLAATAPALLESFDLSARRALALRRAAREISRGRIDLDHPDHERAWRRLREIPEIGSWTVESLALHGQGRLDQVPAGDLSLLKFVGRALSGDPRARADELQVRRFFARYAPWGGLAATYAMRGLLTLPGLGGTRL